MMSRAKALVVTVLVFGPFASALPSQTIKMAPPVIEERSHQRLGGGLEGMTDPESELKNRLSASRFRQMKKDFDPKQFDGELGKLAGKMLQDKKFLESLKGQLSQDDIDQLKQKFQDGKFSAEDKGFRDLLEKAKNADVAPQDKAALDRIADRMAKNPADLGQGKDNPIPDGPPNGNPQNPPTPTPSEPSPWQRDSARANEWMKGGLDGFVKNMDKWVDTPSGKSWGESLKNLASRAESGRASTAKIGERTSALSRLMGRMSGRNSDSRLPQMGNPSLPNMPSLGAPSVSLSGGSLAGSGSVLVVLLGLLLLGLLLWRGRELFNSMKRVGRSAWKLGPWPVRPEDVTTRGDLVRAFEYLALLCLGPTARTCHHLELGKRIGSQPALDAERRRESATVLSRLYERARYTPDQEPLPGDDIRRARRELAYLAGASA